MSIRISLAIKALLVVFTPYIGVSTPFQAHLFRLVTEVTGSDPTVDL